MILTTLHRHIPSLRRKSLLCCTIPSLTTALHPKRNINSGQKLHKNYEGDGKTTVSFLNRDHRHLIMIDSISTIGFRLSNGIFVVGPVAAFPRSVLQWRVRSFNDITPETLSLFCVLEPKLDMLIIGTGDKQEILSKDVLKFMKSQKIALEVLTSEKACSTFNFLNAEARCVAGAFLPPKRVTLFEENVKILGTDDRFEALLPHKMSS